jgi:hypothetical protein
MNLKFTSAKGRPEPGLKAALESETDWEQRLAGARGRRSTDEARRSFSP